MAEVAERESCTAESVRERVAVGRVVIPANRNHQGLRPIGIGKGLSTKVNANIGTSGDFPSLEEEMAKLEVAVRYGADTVMDLSTGGDIDGIRRQMISRCPVPLGNVPVYQMAREGLGQMSTRTFVNLDPGQMLSVVERHARDGVDYMTIHAGLTRSTVELLRRDKRLTGIVSRGGSMMAAWMLHNDQENPFLEHFDELMAIMGEHDVTLSLGDGLRPGCLEDGTDQAQLEELMMLGRLVRRAREAGVQVMVEGPGHLPIQQVRMNVELQKRLCDEAPFYVLGPLVTDIAPGYDHITSAIGGALAAWHGADFLCYVTPAEHLGLPDAHDVREGVVAARIAAHAGDIGKGITGALDRDRAMARARRDLDWDGQARCSLDPERVVKVRRERATETEACSMCGDLCVFKLLKDYL